MNSAHSQHSTASTRGDSKPRPRGIDTVRKGLPGRYARERRFRYMGLGAVLLSFFFVGLLFLSIIGNGYTAFLQTKVLLDVTIDGQVVDPTGKREPATLAAADYTAIVKRSLSARFPSVNERSDKRALNELLSSGAAFELRAAVLANPDRIDKRMRMSFTADDTVDMFNKGQIERTPDGSAGPLSKSQVTWLDELRQNDQLRLSFNTQFFTGGDSREPELAGIWGAAVGSFYTLLVTLLLAFPVGVAAAIHLEEFAPRNRWTDLIEVNVNNLAAVPSIVFGLLGLAVFINFLAMPRSAPIVGGIVLALMTLPVIIVASRSALKAVPPSIRDAALGVGASRVQTVFHHVVPLALPGMLTGTIIGMARALGETAPLLMIGMVAFIADVPHSVTDPATGLPVQIYLWADSPERAFMERTSAAILILLAFMVLMNSVAVILRRRFERRW